MRFQISRQGGDILFAEDLDEVGPRRLKIGLRNIMLRWLEVGESGCRRGRERRRLAGP